MFSDNVARSANFGSRAAADAMCNAMSSYPHACSANSAHAILCFSSQDNVANMPSAFNFSSSSPIASNANGLVATSWTNAVSNGALLSTLSKAGVASADYWTGCYSDGRTSSALSCQAWTTTSGFSNTFLGSSTSTSSSWLSSSVASCATSHPLVCMCASSTAAPTATAHDALDTTTSSSSLSAGVVAGISLGALVGAAVGAVVAVGLMRRRSSQTPPHTPRAGGSIVSRAFETQPDSFVAANPRFGEAQVAADGTAQGFRQDVDRQTGAFTVTKSEEKSNV